MKKLIFHFDGLNKDKVRRRRAGKCMDVKRFATVGAVGITVIR